MLEAAEVLQKELTQLTDGLRALETGKITQGDEFLADLENRLGEVAELIDIAASLTEADDDSMVYWYELPPDRGKIGVKLYAAPLHVGQRLHDQFFSEMRSVVMTSATLAVAGKFNYFLDRVGLTGLQGERVRTLEVGSPFDYDSQAFVAVPEWFPNPRDRGFQDAVTDLVRDVVLGVGRGTLVLFTSYSMLDATYRRLSGDFYGAGVLLLGQGHDGSRTNIAETFRQEEKSVLFGTESFWQGVDIPGESLEVLIIVKLPFSVPSEPLLVAQNDELRKQGKDPFLYLTVPETAIRFRQGFGRLIRSRRDSGAVIILDTRVVTERYGRAFLLSLPTEHRSFRSSDELVSSLEAWFTGERGASETEEEAPW